MVVRKAYELFRKEYAVHKKIRLKTCAHLLQRYTPLRRMFAFVKFMKTLLKALYSVSPEYKTAFRERCQVLLKALHSVSPEYKTAFRERCQVLLKALHSVSPDVSLVEFNDAFNTMRLKKCGERIHLCRTPFSILKNSVVCPSYLMAASCVYYP